MKKDNKKEREIYTVGRSRLEKLSKNELNVFYSTLLSCVVEYYKEKNYQSKIKIKSLIVKHLSKKKVVTNAL